LLHDLSHYLDFRGPKRRLTVPQEDLGHWSPKAFLY
jgi:hypothetical protein